MLVELELLVELTPPFDIRRTFDEKSSKSVSAMRRAVEARRATVGANDAALLSAAAKITAVVYMVARTSVEK